MSSNLPSVGTGPEHQERNQNSNFGAIVAGHGSAVATAEQLSKTETYRDPDSFADIVRGMHLYGRKILRPEAIVTAKYNAVREGTNMATFDLTAKSTTGVGANSIATLPANAGTHMVRTIQEYLDIDALIARGNTIADGDVLSKCLKYLQEH